MDGNTVEKAINLLVNSKLSSYKIAKATKIAESTIGNYRNGRTKPTRSNADTLISFLTGEGEMLRHLSEDANASSPKRTSITTEMQEHQGREDYRLVPCYNLDAVGGVDNDICDTTEAITHYVPFVGAQNDDICLPIFGNSMYPNYPAGCVVLVREVEMWREFLEMGRVYVMCLTDGRRLIKELRRSEENPKESYLCVSHNKDFEPVELPKTMIAKVFLVRSMYNNLGM